MKNPKILILSGYGLNCEEETAYAFSIAGGRTTIVHINDLIANKKTLAGYQILAVPGGFSYGDDTGSGKAYANKLKNHLNDALRKFAEQDKLIIGICNGFQILTNFGLLPGALTFNDFPRYTTRWADVLVSSRPPSRDPEPQKWIPDNFSDALKISGMTQKASPWLRGVKSLSLPIAHGEGKFYANSQTLAIIKKQKQIAGIYAKGEICKMQQLEPNPNGSLLNIAMLTSQNGKILGTMPHPERAIFFTQHPYWTLLKEQLIRQNKPIPKFAPALQIFKNAVEYYRY